jgi:hypothetical protein
MSLDKLLKENAAWFEKALKQQPFEQVGETALNFTEEQRQRRMTELKSRVEELGRRKEEAIASYDQAISVELAELESLDRAVPVVAVQPKPVMPKPVKKRGK